MTRLAMRCGLWSLLLLLLHPGSARAQSTPEIAGASGRVLRFGGSVLFGARLGNECTREGDDLYACGDASAGLGIQADVQWGPGLFSVGLTGALLARPAAPRHASDEPNPAPEARASWFVLADARLHPSPGLWDFWLGAALGVAAERVHGAPGGSSRETNLGLAVGGAAGLDLAITRHVRLGPSLRVLYAALPSSGALSDPPVWVLFGFGGSFGI